MEFSILGINASPRKHGNTSKMLSIALKAAESEGARVEAIHLYDYRIKPCMGCLSDEPKKCRYPCVINDDDMGVLYEKVLEADGLIIASPIYWFNVPGQLKNFIDRLTAFENMIVIDGRCWIEGKVAGVMAIGADSGEIELIANLFATLNSMGMIIPPWALAYTKDSSDVLCQERALMDAANVGRSVALMVKIIKGRNIEWYDPKILDRIKKEMEVIRRAIPRSPQPPLSTL